MIIVIKYVVKQKYEYIELFSYLRIYNGLAIYSISVSQLLIILIRLNVKMNC